MADYLMDSYVLILHLSFPDGLYAATSLGHGLTLATTNARHFPMEGLQVLPLELAGWHSASTG